MRQLRTAKSCGPDAPTLASSLRRSFVSDGGKKARSPGRARRKPLKPLRREGRVSRRTCGDYSCAFYPLHTRLRVRRAPGFPCALVFEGTGHAQLGRIVSRDRGVVFEIRTPSLRGANGPQRRFRNAEAWVFEK